MGYWFFGGHGGFYIPSYDGSQPRPAGPYRPLLYGTVPYEEQIRRMEEGVRLRQRPPPNPTVWKYFKIFTRCFMAAMSIAMMAWIFVARYFGSDPEVQDPYIMMGLIVFALIPVGFGFMCFMAAMSIAMMAWIFVAQYFNWNPDVQDPYKMMALLPCSLIPVGLGFMITEEDQGEVPHS